eukprot:13886597-Alexandrium_andersonii.AAC.1
MLQSARTSAPSRPRTRAARASAPTSSSSRPLSPSLGGPCGPARARVTAVSPTAPASRRTAA